MNAAREIFAADRLPEGTRLGAYAVEAIAFEGGFATVYRGRDTSSGEAVAIKVLRGALAESSKMIVRFQREAEAIRRLAHPGIVRLHEVGEIDDGRPYLVMEWLAGRTLREELRARGPFTARETVAILDELGAALDAVHALGIVHRDLKAQNVIALPRGDWFSLVLVNFGIAKLRSVEPGAVSLTTQTILCTPQTAAPEQILGGRVDARTDVYATGVLAFQLLTGRLPFEAETAIELEELHVHAPPPRVSELAAVPRAVDEVILRAMAKHPDDRPGSVGALVEALRRAAAGGRGPHEEPPLEVPGIGVWVSTRADDETTFEAADSVLALAERALTAAGLELAVDLPSALLAVAETSAVDADAVERAAREVLTGAAAIPGGERLSLEVALHRAAMRVQRLAGARELIGGELLRPATWPADCRLTHA